MQEMEKLLWLTVLASRAYETEKAPAHLEPIPVEVVGKQRESK